MDPQRMFGMTPWVRRLMVANLVVFLLQLTIFVNPWFEVTFGFVPLDALARPWTFLTYMFLHANFLHLAVNLLAAVLSLATFFWAEEPYVRWTLPLVAAVFTTGLLATALAFSVQAWAQQFTSPTHTGLIFSMEPVFAWITSYVVASETIGGRGAWGALLILLGIVLSEARPS